MIFNAAEFQSVTTSACATKLTPHVMATNDWIKVRLFMYYLSTYRCGLRALVCFFLVAAEQPIFETPKTAR
jgi:hypothetical protein